MEMLRVIGVRARSEDRLERPACGHPDPGEKVGFPGVRCRRDVYDPTAGQLEAADVDGIAEGMFGEFGRAVAGTADESGAVADGDEILAEYGLGGRGDDIGQETCGCLCGGAIEYRFRRDIDAPPEGLDDQRVSDDAAWRLIDRGMVGKLDAECAQSGTACQLIRRNGRNGPARLVCLFVALRRGGRGGLPFRC